MTDDDEYYTRAALHGSIDADDVPGDITLTDEEVDALIEILYTRKREQYTVYSRHNQTLFLDHGSGSFDEFEDVLAAAIDLARDEGLPLLKRVYSYVPTSEAADELGADRIPIPWSDDEE